MPSTETRSRTPRTTITIPIQIPTVIAKPLFAYVGAGDAALEAVREAARTFPGSYQAAAKARQDALTTQVKELRGSVQAQVKELPSALTELRVNARAQVKDLPELVRTFPAKASGQASARAEKVPAQAQKQVAEIREYVTELPEAVSKLPDTLSSAFADLQKQATGRVEALRGQATTAFEEYAARGEKLVDGLTPKAPAKPAAKPTAKKTALPKTATPKATRKATPAVVSPTQPVVASVVTHTPAAPLAEVVVELPTEAGDSETISTPLGTVHVPATHQH